METYPLIDTKDNHQIAFEIENAYIGVETIVRLLAGIIGIADIRKRKPFIGSSEIHVEFKYLNRDYIVWEPYGDSGRYWIGPKNPDECTDDIGIIENTFKCYRPPFYRTVFGDILSFRLFKARR